MKITSTLVLASLFVTVRAQEPTPAAPDVSGPAAADREGDVWSEGFGRATSYRAALGEALEDAVAKVKGMQIARGPAIRSRLSVVTESMEGGEKGWFDGQSDEEKSWVQQQIAGFVVEHEVTKKNKGDDGMWEVTVRALIAGLDRLESAIVVQLVDNDLRKWQLERYEEDGAGRPFARQAGEFDGPKISEYLRKSGAIKVVSGGLGVVVGDGSALREREKGGQEVVASHRIVIDWKPLVVQSLVERPNRARPTAGPRPEFMNGGAVQVTLRIENLVERTLLLDESFAVQADSPGSYSADRLEAFVTKLVDKAKAVVATKIYFTLRRPVVLRKWAGEGGDWFVEASISQRVAAGFTGFAVGNYGSLANPDWQNLAGARLVGGSDTSCTFQLFDVVDATRIEADVSEVRPVTQ